MPKTETRRHKALKDFLLQPESTPHVLYPIHAKLETQRHKEWIEFMKVETTELAQCTIGQLMDQASRLAHAFRVEHRSGKDDTGWHVAMAFKSRINVPGSELIVFYSKSDKDLWQALHVVLRKARMTTKVAD